MNTSNTTELQIRYLDPKLLTPDPRNPRLHKPPQIAAIARSIRTFGFVTPVLIDADGGIIAGHGRVAAANKLGLATIPVLRIEHLSPEQRQAYRIADNRLTDTSSWDEQLLGEVLRDLSVAELDFDLDAIGFSVGEIDMKIEAASVEIAPDDPADAVPVLEGPAATLPGDLWLVGRHRLLCGDSLSAESWTRLMAGEKAHMAFTDAPYNIPVDGFISGLGKVRHREFAQAAGELDREEFTAFLTDAFRHIAANLLPGALAYTFMDHRHIGEIMSAGESAFSELRTMCVWVKPSGGMGSFYRNRMELVFIWKNGRGRHRNNVELGRNGRTRTTVWEYPGIAGFRHSEGVDLLKIHPTCKPVKLVADAILDVTARGEMVVDAFMGSGTTTLAAERVGRVARGIEIDPVYVDATLARFENLTGEQAILEETGETFAAVAARRAVTTEEGR